MMNHFTSLMHSSFHIPELELKRRLDRLSVNLCLPTDDPLF